MGVKLGVNLGYWGIGPAGEEALEAVVAAEGLGYESIWVAESYGSDVVSVLAWLAGQTKKVNLGAAIMQVPARPPAAAAMAGATIDKLSGGRFLFGFGPSGPQVSEGWYGVPYAKPWGRTREYIEVVREIIAREGPLEHHGTHYDLPLPGAE
ncbi:MAG TPA: LLM class flavin-dependent oxidoreductase, partial [Solirubrobacterales bacterium]|nr:LLM class flavin-dependent oxidoreductase [Solirubrobacterales bacterium]